MKLEEVKDALKELETVNFVTPDGSKVPEHFHVTEVGVIRKNYIDCGGTVRDEKVVSFQLFVADDYDHRLSTEKLQSIIEMSEKQLDLDTNLEVEVEYQGETIGKYGLAFDGSNFVLQSTLTDCLAKDQCGIDPGFRPKVEMPEPRCIPGEGCC